METEAQLEKRIVELEAQLEQSKEECAEVKAREERSTGKCLKLKEKLVSEDKKWKETLRKSELEQRKLEIDLKVSAKKSIQDGRKLNESEAEVHRLMCLMDEKDATIRASLVKIDALEKRKAEIRNAVERIKGLEGEKRALEDKCRKADSELERAKREMESERMGLGKEKAEMGAEMHKLKSRLEMDCEAKRAREADTRRVEEEKISGLVQKIHVLEKAKAEREAEVRIGADRIADVSRALEAVKKRMGKASKRIKALECEKRALEDKCGKLADSGVEMTKLEAEHDRKILELISRVEEVERQDEAEDVRNNRGFMERMEWMEKERVDLNDKTWDRIEKEVMGSTLAKSAAAPQNQALGSSVEKEIRTKKCTQKWESSSEMCDAFTTNDELCMRSVCALYRKHKSLGSWKNCSSSNTAFKPIHEKMGMALGELLTNGDPQGRMKKSLPQFKRTNPLDLQECTLIATEHITELFEIYNNNLDPLFMPDEC